MMGFPWAKVNSITELLASPQLKERGFFTEVVDPDSGKYFTCPGAPAKMGATPFLPGTRIPRHGEHTGEVLTGELGIPEPELESLHQEGVI